MLMETIIETKCRPFFKEKHSCLLKPFSWIFGDIPAIGSGFFQLVEMEFSSNPSSRLVYTEFQTVCFYSELFLLLESITEIGCKPVFFDFSVPNSGGSFSS